jgi:very-short-patch-repair endonuclease
MTILETLERDRQQLLDIGTRNRLVSTPRFQKRNKQIEVVHEQSRQLFEVLAVQKKSMTFLATDEEDRSDEEVDEVGAGGQLLALMAAESTSPNPGHFSDTQLQTNLSPKMLQKRLRELQSDSVTFLEEQGVNPLYLALGFLKWREAGSSKKDRFAPLILLPVELTRSTVNAQFRLTARDEDLSSNLSLQQKLSSEFRLTLPDLPSAEDLDVDRYFGQVNDAVSSQSEWQVLNNDVQLGFFQFAKFLMYRDLDAASWPEQSSLLSSELLRGLLQDGFAAADPVVPSIGRIDDHIASANMVHVVDADSSQTAAIEEIRVGRHLVIQGPPGTGKSQTITNLIATAVRDGKRVLFLSEKKAALDVVKKRLQNIGLAPMCLELHSNKSGKKQVLQELEQTLRLRKDSLSVDHAANSKVDELRSQLNRVADILHTPAYQSGLTPFVIMGRLIHLHDQVAIDPEIQQQLVLPTKAIKWTPQYVTQLREHLRALTECIQALKFPATHPFRGASCGILLRSDSDRLRMLMQQARDGIEQLLTAGAELAASVGVAAARDTIKRSDIPRLRDLAIAMATSPAMDHVAIASDVWDSESKSLAVVAGEGAKFKEAQARLNGRLNDGALNIQVAEARQHLNAYGRQFVLLRLLNGKYRKAMNTLREVLCEAPPKSIQERLRLLDDILHCQKFKNKLEKQTKLIQDCKSAFGALWQGEESDWTKLQAIVSWVQTGHEKKLHKKFRSIRSRFKTPPVQLNQRIAQLDELLASVAQAMQGIVQLLAFDFVPRFTVTSWETIPLQQLSEWLQACINDFEALPDWVRYRLKRDELLKSGLQSLIQLLDREQVDANQAESLFIMNYYEHLLRSLHQDEPLLAQFSGMSHERLREQFCEADHRMIEATRDEVSSVHRANIPSGSIGGMGVIRHEIQKKSRHKAIRRLIREAGAAIQKIKPVFMMSPLSIAQYLEPGAVEFEILLIDEASQIEPVDAYGAIARSKQIVVVGDQKQLPPTQFFTKSAEVDETEEDNTARDLESILGLCIARGLSQRMLMWHYRSQHQSLIAVSNSEYYENQLFVVPSPIRQSETYGVKFRFVKDGIYDRGGKQCNPPEARIVAEAIIQHARHFPQTSLGVGAFSVKQRDAIKDELELLQRNNPDLSAFFGQDSAEPFFVKNLENIQGDERDVIFISVGYGRDKDGYMTQNYGPLNRDGGERRLNVLISRAKQQCVVFSSITSDDIDLNRANARGVVGLKKFLQFAEKGFSDIGQVTGKEHDSEFEREVANAIAGYGHKIEAQVGVAGFFIDLAVVDSNNPGRYLLGIECDGAAYHSSRSARDRDRLREEVLKNRQWQIHRIWSTDWYLQPKKELENVLNRIESLRTSSKESTNEHGSNAAESRQVEPSDVDETSIPPEVDIVFDAPPSSEYGIPTTTYQEASFRPAAQGPPADFPPKVLLECCLKIIQIEGPIHVEEVARRIASLSGGRAVSRAVAAVGDSIQDLVQKKQVTMDGSFVSLVGTTEATVRDRSGVTASTLRKTENLPPSEVALAITLLIRENGNAERDEIVRAVARVLGVTATIANFKAMVNDLVTSLVESGELADRDGVLSIGDWEKCRSRQ